MRHKKPERDFCQKLGRAGWEGAQDLSDNCLVSARFIFSVIHNTPVAQRSEEVFCGNRIPFSRTAPKKMQKKAGGDREKMKRKKTEGSWEHIIKSSEQIIKTY